MQPPRARSWIIGGAAAVAAGTVVAVPFVIADWSLNPGGIFYDENGTHWSVVVETGLSWFLPVALIVFVMTTAFHYWLALSKDRHQ